MSLFLPERPAQLVPPKAVPVTMGVVLASEHLGGQRATIADLMAQLVNLKRSDVRSPPMSNRGRAERLSGATSVS
jgi:hypothetical protein